MPPSVLYRCTDRSERYMPPMARHTGDVGHDLYVVIRDQTWLDRIVSWLVRAPVFVIWPHGSRNLPSELWLDMSDSECWCILHARSSSMRFRKLMVLGGVIDGGYQGELFTTLYNFGFKPRLVHEGDRLAQVIFYRPVVPQFEYAERFHPTTRGSMGYGSTGR